MTTDDQHTQESFDYKWQAFRLWRLINAIAEPCGSVCHHIVSANWELFSQAPGSRHNHQNWSGGYLDHVTEVMYLAYEFYTLFTDKLYHKRPVPFTLSDALLTLFFHDFEKPWKYELGPDGQLHTKHGFETKQACQKFRLAKIAEYGLVLPEHIVQAIQYTEGESHDYNPNRRVMSELAAFCHMCDVCSARIFYDYPLPNTDIRELEERRVAETKADF